MDILPKKSLGQNFLNNPRIPKRMVDAALIERGDVVLEIGPGTGVLTRELLTRGAQVVAVEADVRAILLLKSTFKEEIAAQRLTIIHADARTLDLASLGLREQAYKVVSNIPYYLSGMLFRTLLETAVQPSTIVFLVQKEVALRIARDTKESLLSLSVKVYGKPRYVATVARGNFTPSPRVDSAIIAIAGISRKNFVGMTERDFFDIIHLGFASRRKQLLGNLSKRFERDVLVHTFSTLGIPQTARGEDLNINVWLSLVKRLSVHT